tara:strand:- start:434 stop:1009 length:576 start_codon:yes stop_codon:yes gene_type:complete
MKLWKYKNYEEYVRVQTEGNVNKLKNVWADQQVFDLIAKYKPDAKDVICHGTRNGAELDMFKKAIPSLYHIIGTEISHTAKQFPNTIQHDFHNQIPSYVNKFDIVYSNSIDHSYDPFKALKTWTEQVNQNGLLCIELATGHENRMRELDPLEISPKELTQIIEEEFGFFNNDFKVINRLNRTNSLLGIYKR